MRFTPSHEWILLKGTQGTVGITEYAQKELGEIVYVELPPIGKIVKAGEEVCVLESTKAAADVYAPLSGKITAVNETLRAHPSAINQAAETHGWLFQLEATHPKEYEALLALTDYKSLIS
ncbi:MAG TPA: glycine cleavage system protein GcvH [Chlamydiales bacterium]|nr:glycine cleavage system protein GcvH [Chlamydiales bacterium]